MIPGKQDPQFMSRVIGRWPYVLFDSVTDIDRAAGRVIAVKCASFADPYYPGHFPDNPVMPGVLLLMAFSQVASVLYEGEEVFLRRIERVRFQSPVRPGQRVALAVEETARTEGNRILACRATVDAKEAVRARLIVSDRYADGGH